MDNFPDQTWGDYDKSQGPSARWYVIPVAIAIVLFIPCVFFGPGPGHRLVVFVAFVNCLLIAGASIFFIRTHTLQGLIPILFLIWFGLGWPVASIIFAVWYPEIFYTTMAAKSYHLEGNLRLQTALLTFLIAYITILMFFMPRGERNLPIVNVSAPSQRAIPVVVLLTAFALFFFTVTSLFQASGLIGYFGHGFFKYFNALPFIIGAYWIHVTKKSRIFLCILFLGCGYIFTIANARGMAIAPIALFFLGLLFCSAIKQRTKFIMIITVALLFPAYLVIGNTTRLLTNEIGFSDFAYRVQALGRWREVYQQSDSVASTFGRLFSTGGHSIVTRTPEEVPYMEFSLGKYTMEFVTKILIPGRLYNISYYSSSITLRDYDIRVSEETSVELSMVGAFWRYGGYFPVLIGGVIVGLFHTGLGYLLRGAMRKSALRGIFFLAGITYHLIWAQNLNFILHAKNLLWSFVIYALLYHIVLKLLVGAEDPARPITTVPRGQLEPHRVGI